MATRGLIGMVTAGAGIVVLVAVLVRSGGEATGPRGRAGAGSGSVAAGGFGVHGDDVDSARRVLSEGPPGRAERMQQRVKQFAEAERVVEAPLVSSEPPAPPVPPSAEAIAEAEVILAATPAVREAVEQGVERRRGALRRSCWTGEVPDSASLPIEVSYSAEGTMLALSVGDDVGAPGIGNCVRDQSGVVPATIEAPGVPVTVRTALRLP